MAKDDVARIIGRAVMDKEFAEILLKNPEEAVKGFDLTPEELEAIKAMKKESVEKLSDSLDKRIVKTETAKDTAEWWPSLTG